MHSEYWTKIKNYCGKYGFYTSCNIIFDIVALKHWGCILKAENKRVDDNLLVQASYIQKTIHNPQNITY